MRRNDTGFVLKGRILTFGNNDFGQLGVEVKEADHRHGRMYTIHALDSFRTRQIMAGPKSSFFLTTKGEFC